jgi:SAM-dependent methyltransferase
MEKTILNLGCGKTRIPGSIGVDSVMIEGYVDKVHDLDIVPYPFESSSVDEIHLYHVLEHLHDPVRKMEEMHRILKPDGALYIRVPHFSSRGAFTDITHLRPYGYESFDCFTEGNEQHYYTEVSYDIISKQIKYFGMFQNTGAYAEHINPNRIHWALHLPVMLINWLITLSPKAFERFWCYWVGGAVEVVVELKKV